MLDHLKQITNDSQDVTPRNSSFAATPTQATENLRSKSNYSKFLANIFSHGQQGKATSTSPYRYPQGMRSTSQEVYRPYRRDEIRGMNPALPIVRPPPHKPRKSLADEPQDNPFETSNQHCYPNYWISQSFDLRDLRPSSRSIVKEQTFHIFRKDPNYSDLKPPTINLPNQNTARWSPNSKSNVQGTDFRGRAVQRMTFRRGNETSPDFPFDQPGKKYLQQAEGNLKPSSYDQLFENTTAHLAEEGQSSRDSSVKKEKLESKPSNSASKLDNNITPQSLLHQDKEKNDNFTSINQAAPDSHDPVVKNANQNRYGPAKRLPKKGQSKANELEKSGNKRHGVLPLGVFSASSANSQNRNEQPEIKLSRSPNNQILKKKTQNGDENYPFEALDQSDSSNLQVERQPRTPTKQKKIDDNFLNQSDIKSPQKSLTPTKRNKLALNHNVRFENDSNQKESIQNTKQEPKAQQTAKTIERNQMTLLNVENRTKSPNSKSQKYDEMKSIYQQDYKEILLANFLREDCPLFGLPKPPKKMEKGKTHFYYNEERNIWN